MRSASICVLVAACAAVPVHANTWKGPAGTGGAGNWGQASNWSDGTVPNSSVVDVLIDGGKAGASSVTLENSYSIRDLTIDSGDGLTITPARQLYTYGNVALNGTLTLDGSTNTPYLLFYGTSGNPASLTGTGTLNLAASDNYVPQVRNDYSTTNKVTIGSGVTVNVSGGGYFNGWFDSNAAMGVSTSGRTLTLNGYDQTRRFTNTATLSASNGSTLQLLNVTNTGTVNLNSSTLELGGTFTAGDIGTINRTGTSTVAITGTLQNAASTLALTAATGSYELRNSGRIRNGTISTAGGASLVVPNAQAGFLENVTVAAGSDVRAIVNGSSSSLFIENGGTLDGTLTLDGSANLGTPYLYFNAAANADFTYGGTGTLRLLGSESYAPQVRNNTSYNNKVTLGSGLTIDAAAGGRFDGYFDSNVSIATTTNNRTLTLTGYDATRRFTNNATVSLTNGANGQFVNFTNAGTVSLAGGATANFNAFSNTGTITVGNGAAATFGGEFTTAELGTVTRTGTGRVILNGLLENGGATLALTAATGDLEFNGGGRVRNGTISTTGGSALVVPVGQNGYVESATLTAGDIRLNGGSNLYVQNGLTVNGTVNLNSTDTNGPAYLRFTGTSDQTLGGTGTIRLVGTNTYRPQIYNVNSAYKTTIGSGLTVDAAGGGDLYGFITNNAAIAVSTAGRVLTLQGTDPFRRLVNNATLTATNGSFIEFNGNVLNNGTVSLNGSTLTTNGDYTTAALGTITQTGASNVFLNGALDNTGATLALNNSTGSFDLRSITVRNGSISTAGTASLNARGGFGPTLNNVTLTAGSNINVSNSASLYVQGGGTINGTVSLDATADNGTPFLRFNGTGDQTLGGTGTIRLLPTTNYVPQIRSDSGQYRITLGGGLTVDAAQGGVVYGAINNAASIGVSTSGKTLSIEGIDDSRRFVNTGTISASNGSTVQFTSFTNNGVINLNNANANFNSSNYTTGDIGTINRTGTGTVSLNGTIDNTGRTLTLTAATGSFDLRGVLRGGTIAASGGATLNFPTNAGPYLEGVTVAPGTALAVRSNGNVYVRNGLTLNGTINLDASTNDGTPYLYFNGDAEQALSGTGTVRMIPSVSYIPQLYNPTSNSRVTVGSGITIDAAAGGYLNGWFTSAATASVSTAGKTLYVRGNDLLRRYTNTGTFDVSNGATLEFSSNFTNTGTVNLNDATVTYNSDYRTADIGTINRTGANSSVIFNGTLDNTDATFATTAAGGNYELRGVVRRGTIATAAGTAMVVTPGHGATLDSTTIAAGANVRAVSNSTVYLQNTITLNGTLALDASGDSSYPTLQFVGSADHNVAGTGTLRMISGTTTSYVPRVYNGDTTYRVNLGSGITVDATGYGEWNGWATSNAAFNINGGGTAKNFDLNGTSPTKPFTNQGRITVGGNAVLRTNIYFVNSSGVIDVRSGRAELAYSGTSTLPAVYALLDASFDTNFSTGPYQSSTAVVGKQGLGYRDTGSSVIVQAALYGDANLDGQVNFTDFVIVQANFGQTGRVFTQGDFNYDGITEFTDFVLLQSNFGQTISGARAAFTREEYAAVMSITSAGQVPEPAAIGLIGLAGIGLLRRRRTPAAV